MASLVEKFCTAFTIRKAVQVSGDLGVTDPFFAGRRDFREFPVHLPDLWVPLWHEWREATNDMRGQAIKPRRAGSPRVPLLGLLLLFGFSSCAPESPIAEPEYRAKIVGNWIGTVGDMKETMSFDADGTFVAQVRPAGFISNTLSQGVTGTVRGTWTLTGTVITMKITSAENERLQNKVTSSTIVAFRQDQLVVRSVSGETSTFLRAV